MEIPSHVLQMMKNEREKLTNVFERIWGLLPKTPERDDIMLRILQAKTALNQYIKDQEER